MASLHGGGSPPLSIKHGVRIVAEPRYTVEQVLLAVGEQVGHENISYGSRMSKAVVAFLREERLVHLLVERGLVLDDLYVPVSPLFVPSTRITVSGVPPFIPNEMLERELLRFGKFASGFRTVRLGCKDAKLQHVQSLRRQAFMYLNDPEQMLEVSFKVKYDTAFYTVYASSGSMKCFECGDVGHKRAACPHKAQAAGGSGHAPLQQAAGPSAGGAQQGAEGAEHGTPNPEAPQESTVQEKHEVRDERPDDTETQRAEESEGRGQTAGEAAVAESQSAAENELKKATVENDDEDEDMLEDDSLSQFSDIVPQDIQEDQQQSYTLKDINYFLDETFGRQSVDVAEFFPDVNRFITSVLKIRRVVGYDQLSKQKRFRLKKILAKLRKERREKSLST